MPLEQGILHIPVPSSHQDYWLGQRGVSVQLHGWGWVLSRGSLCNLRPQLLKHKECCTVKLWLTSFKHHALLPPGGASWASLHRESCHHVLLPCRWVSDVPPTHDDVTFSLPLCSGKMAVQKRMYPDNTKMFQAQRTKIFIRLHVFSSFHIQKCFTLYECVT